MLKAEEKLKYIFSQLDKGILPNKIAEEMGYKNYGSFKNFICKHGYIWDKEKSKYVKGERKRHGKITTDNNYRAQRVIVHFDLKEEPKEIAKTLGFKGHNEMSEFMKNNGYEWSTKIGNYEKRCEVSSRNTTEIKELDKYIEVLQVLTKNIDGLEEMLSLNPDRCMKKYRITGTNTIKSVQIISTLSDMSREFSRTYNITQKHIFEVALIDFFRKYGFKKEIDHLLREENL